MTPSLDVGGCSACGGDGAGASPARAGSGAAAMEAPGPPAVRARSRQGGPSAPQRHTRGAGRGCRPAPPSRGGGRSSSDLHHPRDACGEGTRPALAAWALPHGSLCRKTRQGQGWPVWRRLRAFSGWCVGML
ncbi:hypothetical protein Nmel_009363 [Mimus melanotis]